MELFALLLTITGLVYTVVKDLVGKEPLFAGIQKMQNKKNFENETKYVKITLIYKE